MTTRDFGGSRRGQMPLLGQKEIGENRDIRLEIHPTTNYIHLTEKAFAVTDVKTVPSYNGLTSMSIEDFRAFCEFGLRVLDAHEQGAELPIIESNNERGRR